MALEKIRELSCDDTSSHSLAFTINHSLTSEQQPFCRHSHSFHRFFANRSPTCDSRSFECHEQKYGWLIPGSFAKSNDQLLGKFSL